VARQLTLARWQEVSGFAQGLDGIEQQRLKEVGDETTRLVNKLVALAHKSPFDIERWAARPSAPAAASASWRLKRLPSMWCVHHRLAEGYASELNMVMVTNREAHADLVAKLEKLDVVARDKGKKALAERQVSRPVESASEVGGWCG
jgi:hypothetical protein